MSQHLPPKYITIHASATYPSMDIGADDIRVWHVKERGWSDIGYHIVIRRNGVVEKGRPLHRVGAHVGGNNTGNLGICMAGGLKEGTQQAEDNFTDAQYQSLTKQLTSLISQYPEAKIVGHNYFPGYESRGCPCFDWEAYVRYLRSAWASLYLPSDWHSRNWKEGIDKDWNDVNIYKEMPVINTTER